MHFERQDFTNLYTTLLGLFDKRKPPLCQVRSINPRGQETLELAEPVSWTIHDPSTCWLQLPGRRLNPFFAAAEILWILSGSGDVAWISQFNSNMKNFSDDGVRFNAAYGERIFWWGGDKELRHNQVDFVVSRLCEDPNSRRAIICLYHPVLDARESKDVACNCIVQFLLREGHLNTSIYQRSNDLIWGTTYNMLQFQHLAQLVLGELEAKGLKAKRGWHRVTVGSLHLYTELYKETLERISQVEDYKGSPVPACYETVTQKEIKILVNNVDAAAADVRVNNRRVGYWYQLAALAGCWQRYKATGEKNWVTASTIGPREERLRSAAAAEKPFEDVFDWLVNDYWNTEGEQ